MKLIKFALSNTLILISGLLLLVSCGYNNSSSATEKNYNASGDSLAIAQMISIREQSMINKDIKLAMGQFSEDATWINSQGYYFEGKNNVSKFHSMLTGNDSLDYYYEAGQPRIRVIDSKNALAYYSWKMFWFKKEIPADTTFKEIGLMTLTAHKQKNKWKWVAVTNQHTPWFYENVAPVTTD
ncbi:MAG: hypothetical protein KAJ23_15825 [Maribacter sp.]|nr:hypothetical protein [Maribacter sp.]